MNSRNVADFSFKKGSRIFKQRAPMSIFIYLFNRFFYRLSEFFRHWYFNSFRIYTHFVISLFEKLDRRLALKITFKHLFHPLYQDRTLIGYILGFFFRTIRLISGGFIYLIFLALAMFFYFVWLAIPVFIIFKIFNIVFVDLDIYS